MPIFKEGDRVIISIYAQFSDARGKHGEIEYVFRGPLAEWLYHVWLDSDSRALAAESELSHEIG